MGKKNLWGWSKENRTAGLLSPLRRVQFTRITLWGCVPLLQNSNRHYRRRYSQEKREQGLRRLPWDREGICWSCSKCKAVNQSSQDQCWLKWYSLKVTQEFKKYHNHKVAKHSSNVHRERLKTFNISQDYSNRRISNNPGSNVTWMLPDPNRCGSCNCWPTNQTVMQWAF